MFPINCVAPLHSQLATGNALTRPNAVAMRLTYKTCRIISMRTTRHRRVPHDSVNTPTAGTSKRLPAIPAILKSNGNPLRRVWEKATNRDAGTNLSTCQIEAFNREQLLKVGLTPPRVLTALESRFYEKMSLHSPVLFRPARSDSNGL
jgi:hypothetical protein